MDVKEEKLTSARKHFACAACKTQFSSASFSVVLLSEQINSHLSSGSTLGQFHVKSTTFRHDPLRIGQDFTVMVLHLVEFWPYLFCGFMVTVQ